MICSSRCHLFPACRTSDTFSKILVVKAHLPDLQDKGSDVTVTLNGEELQKDKEYSLGPGSVLGFGDEALYQVKCCHRLLP